MTISILRTAALFSLTLWLGGCSSSPPNNYYLLTPASGPTASGQIPSLGVGPVEIPEYLNRRAMVHSGGGNILQVSGQERWAEPLEDGIVRVVSLNLANLLDTENIRHFPWDTRQAPDYGVSIRLLTLDTDGRQASLVAEWQVYRPGDTATAERRISSLLEPLAPDRLQAEELAASYSKLLYRLSELIAGSVRADLAARQTLR
jgi:uncharacterized lipoprotein YmbA